MALRLEAPSSRHTPKQTGPQPCLKRTPSDGRGLGPAQTKRGSARGALQRKRGRNGIHPAQSEEAGVAWKASGRRGIEPRTVPPKAPPREDTLTRPPSETEPKRGSPHPPAPSSGARPMKTRLRVPRSKPTPNGGPGRGRALAFSATGLIPRSPGRPSEEGQAPEGLRSPEAGPDGGRPGRGSDRAPAAWRDRWAGEPTARAGGRARPAPSGPPPKGRIAGHAPDGRARSPRPSNRAPREGPGVLIRRSLGLPEARPKDPPERRRPRGRQPPEGLPSTDPRGLVDPYINQLRSTRPRQHLDGTSDGTSRRWRIRRPLE